MQAQLKALPPLVFAGEARQLRSALAARRRRARRSCCTSATAPSLSATSPRRASATTSRSCCRWPPCSPTGGAAGGQAGTRGRAVRQAALEPLRACRRPRAALVPRPHGQRRRPDPRARIPDPQRMLMAYNQSASRLNLLRAFTKGGFADLTQVHFWNQEFVARSPEGRRYERSPWASRTRCASCRPAASTCSASTPCTKSTCGRATKVSCSPTRSASRGATA